MRESEVRASTHTLPIRILVSEPDAVSRRLICSLLECEAGMTVTCVDDSRLVSSIQESVPDLVILDVHTPAIGRAPSWEAVGIRRAPATIVTAYDPSAVSEFASSAIDFLVKPFDAERFEAALDLARLRIAGARMEFDVRERSSAQEQQRLARRFLQRLAVEADEKIVLAHAAECDSLTTASIGYRIRAFRTDRIIALANNQAPIPFIDAPTIVLHCIPLESFVGQPQYNVLPFYDNSTRLMPMGTTSWDRRLNLEGLIVFGTATLSYTYTQLGRNGIVEVVHGNILAHDYNGQLVIPSVSYEESLMNYLPVCFRVLQEIGSGAPVVVALTLLKTRGLVMGVDSVRFERGNPIDRDTIVLPEVVVEDLSTPPGKILKPLLDLVWNASGYPSSKNFDSEGNWVKRR